MPESDLALVTGASRGIGRAIALALGSAGATVVGTATTPEGADQIAAALAAAVQELPQQQTESGDCRFLGRQIGGSREKRRESYEAPFTVHHYNSSVGRSDP